MVTFPSALISEALARARPLPSPTAAQITGRSIALSRGTIVGLTERSAADTQSSPPYARGARDCTQGIFAADERARLLRIASTSPLDREQLVLFDDAMPRPSLSRIEIHGVHGPGTLGIAGHGVGRYTIADNDVFRPLQYCAVDFRSAHGDLEGRTRDIVEMASLHLEALIKRIAALPFLPLGSLLLKPRARRKVDETIWNRLRRFADLSNRAKHGVSHLKDAHLFSVQHAVLAYEIARRLAQPLYPMANLTTDLRFESNPHQDYF
jgi:hypothetical protein